jgi:hypothetical protein
MCLRGKKLNWNGKIKNLFTTENLYRRDAACDVTVLFFLADRDSVISQGIAQGIAG